MRRRLAPHSAQPLPESAGQWRELCGRVQLSGCDLRRLLLRQRVFEFRRLLRRLHCSVQLSPGRLVQPGRDALSRYEPLVAYSSVDESSATRMRRRAVPIIHAQGRGRAQEPFCSSH